MAIVLAVMLSWTGEMPGSVDLRIEEFFAGHRTEGAHRSSGWFTRLGGREVVAPIGLVVAAAIGFRRRSLRPVVMMVAVYLLAAGPAAFLKETLHRAEPGDLTEELGRSFPSGHTTQAAAVYGMAAVLWAEGAPRRGRLAAGGVAVIASVVVGVAMVVRGAHWAGDVVAGYAIGVAALVTVTAVSARLRPGNGEFRRRQPSPV
ncbi:MAG: phosphatase PAP2 family protein [Actinomycetota bacterium]|nr:phosphatase PAP2 family protein [Actinomycetota bacterium]